MHTHRVLVIHLVIFMQVSYPAPFSAHHTSVPILRQRTTKTINETEPENNNTVRKFDIHVQIICGIDSFEDDYYGCDSDEPKLNLMEKENVMGSHQTLNITKTTGTTTMTPVTTITTTTNSTDVSSSSICNSTTKLSQTYVSKHVAKSSTLTTHKIQTTVAKTTTKSHPSTVTVPKTTTLRHHATTPNNVFELNTKNKSKVEGGNDDPSLSTKPNTETQKYPSEMNVWPDKPTPRCYEKTINFAKLSAAVTDNLKTFKPLTRSTKVIWVGNTSPDIEPTPNLLETKRYPVF